MSNELINNETNLNDNNSNVELNNNQENNESKPVIQDINKIITVNNYPYGYKLTTTKTYQVEFILKKGFKLIETTKDPKSGKLNKPKKSTYYQFLYLTDNNGFIKSNSIDLTYKYENINTMCDFLYKNHAILNLNNDMLDYIINHLLINIRAGFNWTDGNKLDLLNVFKPVVKNLKIFLNSKDYEVLKDCNVDLMAIEEIRKNATEENSVKMIVKEYQII